MCKTITNIRIHSRLSLNYKFFKSYRIIGVLADKKGKTIRLRMGLTYKINCLATISEVDFE